MKKFIFLALLVLWPSFTWAVAPAQYNGNVNTAVGSIIETKRSQMPTAANDANGASAFSALNTALNSFVPCLPTLAGTWVTYLYCVGTTAVIGTTIQLGINGLVNFITGNTGATPTIQASGTGMPQGVASNFPVIPSSAVTLASYAPGEYYFTNLNGVGARHILVMEVKCTSTSGITVWCSGVNLQSASYLSYDLLSVASVNSTSSVWQKYYSTLVSIQIIGTAPAPALTPIYEYKYKVVLEEIPATGKTITFPAYIPYYGSPSQIMQDVPATQSNVALSDQMLQALANAIINAANPQIVANGGTAIPTITQADIAAWRATHPSLIPTVQDLNTPVSMPGSSTILIPNPNTQSATAPAPGTTPTSVAVTSIDFGTFNASSVNLTPPTAPSILDPIFNLWPAWANFAFPAHTAVCPKPVLPLSLVHMQDVQFDQLCTWTEQVKPTLQAVFSVVWSVMIVLIVMGA